MPSRKYSATPSPPTPSSSSNSKLPRFLQKPNSRDRAKSVNLTEPSPTTSTISSDGLTSIDSSTPPETRSEIQPSRNPRESRNGALKWSPESPTTPEETLVIVEPPPLPRPRTNSERPIGPYSPNASTSRIGDFPTRISGWFTHTFSSSTNDLTLPSVLAHSSSPTKAKSSALLTAAKHGKGHLDKAMRYLLDSDAHPDKCTDPIWLLGVQHSGYEPPPPPVVQVEGRDPSPNGARRRSGESKRRGSSSLRSSTSSASSHESQTTVTKINPWPPVFYADFTTRIWLTYRSQFEPIRDQRLADLACGMPPIEPLTSSPTAKKWHWGGGERNWTSDAGWGCMLRTGQSLLANALLHTHLGRDWRVPSQNVRTADYATYVQIVTWFFDSISPEAPFSVHRMALAGKELGTDVGQWFGPSVAAGAIKQLVHNYSESGIGVSIGIDSVIIESDVYSASHSYGPPRRKGHLGWGDKGVLVLLGIRLGLNGVNPVYYETVKVLFTWPQSVGIAGGRPSSSYYFVGSQADNLFYLDPHHARPTIPMRPMSDIPPNTEPAPHRSPTSPAPSTRTGSSTFSYHAPTSPSPLQNQYSTSSSSSGTSSSSNSTGATPQKFTTNPRTEYRHHHQPSSSTITTFTSSSRPESPMPEKDCDLDASQLHFATAYSSAELKTFHCDRIRKMPLSGLDPSMLLGFLCKNEDDWIDLRRRIADLAKNPQLKPIFSVQDEPPSWPSDSDDNLGLESIDMDLDDEDDELKDGDDEDDEEEQFFDAHHESTSSSSAGNSQNGSFKDKKPPPLPMTMDSDEDEDDFADPVTPGPNTRFEFPPIVEKGGRR